MQKFPKVIGEYAKNVKATATGMECKILFPGPGKIQWCCKPWSAILIKRDGTVMPCCWAKKCFGNIEDFKTIEKIKNSPQAIKFREKIISGNHQEVCQESCPDRATFGLRYFEDIKQISNCAQGSKIFINYLEMLIGEIENKALIIKSFPIDIYTEFSSLCNLECIMCSLWAEHPIRELPGSLAKEIIINIQKIYCSYSR